MSDLKLISQAGVDNLDKDVAIAGGQVVGDEWAEHVVKHRSGIILRTRSEAWHGSVYPATNVLCEHSTLLKSDQWLQDAEYVPNPVRGAISFRHVPGTTIYACGQPTEAAIDEVVRRVRSDFPDTDNLVWICLREEPIVVINGSPYCLRRENFSLRNMKVRLALFGFEYR